MGGWAAWVTLERYYATPTNQETTHLLYDWPAARKMPLAAEPVSCLNEMDNLPQQLDVIDEPVTGGQYEDTIVKALIYEYQLITGKNRTDDELGLDKTRATLHTHTPCVERCIAVSSSPCVCRTWSGDAGRGS